MYKVYFNKSFDKYTSKENGSANRFDGRQGSVSLGCLLIDKSLALEF